MRIAKDHIVSFDYTLTDDSGAVLDASRGAPLAYLHGNRNIIPGLENALEGLAAGDEKKVTVPPGEGYGEFDERLIIKVPAERMGGHAVQVGMRFHAETNAGLRVLTVKEVKPDEVVLDGNHELAGKTLHFDIKVVSVRAAELTELSHGHPHQAGGCCGGGGCGSAEGSEGGCCSTEGSAGGCCSTEEPAAQKQGGCGSGGCGCS